METIGNRIKNLRKKNKFTQEDLADKLFFSNKTISSWENNRTTPDLESINRLSSIFNCSINYLISGNDINNDLEIELKFQISTDDYNRILYNIKKEATFIKEINQIDIYYDLNDNKEQWLRIRTVGNSSSLSLKKNINNESANKYEITFDNKEKLENILYHLGYKELITIDKNRIIYNYNKYEIAIDYIKDLGYFIEIEIINPSIEDDYKNILEVAKHFSINPNNVIYKKYPEILLNK